MKKTRIFNLSIFIIALLASIPMSLTKSQWPVPNLTYEYYLSIIAGVFLVFALTYFLSEKQEHLIFCDWNLDLFSIGTLHNSMVILGVTFLCSGVFGFLISFFLIEDSNYGIQMHFIKLGVTIFFGGTLSYLFLKRK